MTEHELVRELLTLAAAGVLAPDEHRRVEQHAAVCDLCRRELDSWQAYSRELGRLPAPAIPSQLAERTRNRILGHYIASVERRWDDVMMTVLALHGWTMALLAWVLWHVFRGEVTTLFDAGFVKVLIWSGLSTGFAWVTAAIAAVVLGFQRRVARRML